VGVGGGRRGGRRATTHKRRERRPPTPPAPASRRRARAPRPRPAAAAAPPPSSHPNPTPLRRYLAAARGDRPPPDSLAGRTLTIAGVTVRVEGVAGEGGFSTVHRARDAATGAPLALKHVRLAGGAGAADDVGVEVGAMRALAGHPAVLRLVAACVGESPGVPAAAGLPPPPPDAYLLLDLCGESLADVLPATPASGPALADALAGWRAAVAAVAALHALPSPLTHRDIKSENVLRLASAGRAWVLADYGSAAPFCGPLPDEAARAAAADDVRRKTTAAYRAPELVDLHSGEPLRGGVDVWALGVLLHRILTGSLPFDGDAPLAVLAGRYPPVPAAAPPRGAALVAACLAPAPAGRPTAAALLVEADKLLEEVGGAAAVPAPPAPPARPDPAPPSPPAPRAAAAPSPSPRRTRHRSGFASMDDVDGDDLAAVAVASVAAAARAVPAAVATALPASPILAAPPSPPVAGGGGSFWAMAAPAAVATAVVAAPRPPPPRAASPLRVAVPPAANLVEDESASLRAALAAAVAERDAAVEGRRAAEAEAASLRAAAAAPTASSAPATATAGWATFGHEAAPAPEARARAADPWSAAPSSGRRSASEPPPVETWGLP